MICAERLPPNTTVSRLLDGAERSLLSFGYKGASIRRITDEAGAGVASINYHFGSKKGLFAELFRRRFQPVATRRSELLRAIEATTSYSSEDVARAYFGTLFHYREKSGEKVVSVIWMLLNSDPEASQLASECMGDGYADLRHRYALALARAIPGVPVVELEWRLEVLEHFALCAIAGPKVVRTARTVDFPGAGDMRNDRSVSDGLLGIIQACLHAPHAVPVTGAGG